ncbi:lipopolysaccharide biosynthesis protein [Sneathiella chungangensis]|uniref:Lipopolysaccharide biosynthesis protein n=1 Tax=Sneathiella chungangensis TaxID=1418234 RepID=A0A845MLR7_9PROT|nr:lipopolysaccharide biosynthesis protein [Sneathiella chungangensis]MZR23987.1 lipopolysaccharide biosynthesis protein [Sneathiella chungangensis]
MSQDYTLHEEEASPINIERIISAARRRFLFFLIPFLLVLAGSFAVILVLPPLYSSWGTILVETQQISPDLIESTIQTDPDQRIRVIEQRVMTRENLLKIIDKYNVYGDDRKFLTVTDLVGKMQDEIGIDVITSSMSGTRRRGDTTIAFTVAFNHENPQIAADVANELVTLFLSENVRTRTERASEATAFLSDEAEKVRRQLTQVESEIVAYKQKYREALPEHLGLRQSMLDRSEQQIRDLRRDLRALEEDKRYLQIELTSARTGRVGGAGEQTELARNLSSLKDQLLEASTRLTESHPNVIALKKRIEALEKQVEEEAAAALAAASQDQSAASTAFNPLVETLQIRLAAADDKIAETRRQIATMTKKIADLEAIILEIPQVERGLTVLNRTYSDLLEKLNSLESKQTQAQLSQNLEEEKKAERFVMLEPPVVPTEPVSPNRTKILGVGGFVAFALGVACVFLVELLDKRIHSASELEAVLKHPPIVSIPYIHTKDETIRHRLKVVVYMLIPILLIAGLLAAVHYLYEPLDDLFYRVWVAFDRLIVTL